MKKSEYIAKRGILAYEKMRVRVNAWKKENKERKVVTDKAYWKRTKEQQKVYQRFYYESYRKQLLRKQQKYYIIHRDEVMAYHKGWYTRNRDLMEAYRKAWYVLNQEKRLLQQRNYHKTDAGKEVDRRSQAKRRHFGFIPINAPFEGAEGHHMTHDTVMYVPAWINENHALDTGRGMKRVNALALKFLLEGF